MGREKKGGGETAKPKGFFMLEMPESGPCSIATNLFDVPPGVGAHQFVIVVGLTNGAIQVNGNKTLEVNNMLLDIGKRIMLDTILQPRAPQAQVPELPPKPPITVRGNPLQSTPTRKPHAIHPKKEKEGGNGSPL